MASPSPPLCLVFFCFAAIVLEDFLFMHRLNKFVSSTEQQSINLSVFFSHDFSSASASSTASVSSSSACACACSSVLALALVIRSVRCAFCCCEILFWPTKTKTEIPNNNSSVCVAKRTEHAHNASFALRFV